MDVDKQSGVPVQDDPQPDPGRREFVRKAGKALYLAPGLTLLGSVPASAQFGSPPCDPGGGTCENFGAPAPPAPDAPPQ